MLLTEVSKYIKCKKIYNFDKKNINFKYIFTNSKNIKRSSIFAIRDTKKIKKKFINEAISRGAVAILSKNFIKGVKVTQYIVNNIDLSISIILDRIYPKAPQNTIAITGTNGKTSVVWYIDQICHFNKILTKTYGTLGYYINFKKNDDSFLTTPDYEILKQTAFLKKKNLYNYIFEASSQGLDQNRLKNFPINIAAITNITQDHLDYHKNITNYRNAKYKLLINYLNKNGYAVLNDNIKGIETLKKKLKQKKILTYGSNKSDIFLYVDDKKTYVKYLKKNYLLINTEFTSIKIENISCAIACCICLDVKINSIIKVIKKIINPPGRLEEVKTKNNKYKIYIDYAHTPEALKQVLINKTIKGKKPNIVFGCGGDRDKNKRSKMGSIANQYANRIYITDDNPRNENPSQIRKAILLKCKKAIEVPNRKKAIAIAINELNREEILIIAGKGHEKIQITKGSVKLFDDLKIAQLEVIKRK